MKNTILKLKKSKKYAKNEFWRILGKIKVNLKDIHKFTFQSEGLLQIEFFKFSPSDSTEGQSEGNLKEKVLQLNLGEPWENPSRQKLGH